MSTASGGDEDEDEARSLRALSAPMPSTTPNRNEAAGTASSKTGASSAKAARGATQPARLIATAGVGPLDPDIRMQAAHVQRLQHTLKHRQELPRNWFQSEWIERFSVSVDPESGERSVSSGVVDDVALFDWIRKFAFPNLTPTQYRSTVRRNVVSQGPGYVAAALAPDVRQVLLERIEAMGKKNWGFQVALANRKRAALASRDLLDADRSPSTRRNTPSWSPASPDVAQPARASAAAVSKFKRMRDDPQVKVDLVTQEAPTVSVAETATNCAAVTVTAEPAKRAKHEYALPPSEGVALSETASASRTPLLATSWQQSATMLPASYYTTSATSSHYAGSLPQPTPQVAYLANSPGLQTYHMQQPPQLGNFAGLNFQQHQQQQHLVPQQQQQYYHQMQQMQRVQGTDMQYLQYGFQQNPGGPTWMFVNHSMGNPVAAAAAAAAGVPAAHEGSSPTIAATTPNPTASMVPPMRYYSYNTTSIPNAPMVPPVAPEFFRQQHQQQPQPQQQPQQQPRQQPQQQPKQQYQQQQ
jgi:hypothetical protein